MLSVPILTTHPSTSGTLNSCPLLSLTLVVQLVIHVSHSEPMQYACLYIS